MEPKTYSADEVNANYKNLLDFLSSAVDIPMIQTNGELDPLLITELLQKGLMLSGIPTFAIRMSTEVAIHDFEKNLNPS